MLILPGKQIKIYLNKKEGPPHMNYFIIKPNVKDIYHHGILGQKWGVRRYQYEDGTLTPAGKARYSKMYKDEANKTIKSFNKKSSQMYVNAVNKTADQFNNGLIDEFYKTHKPTDPDHESSYMEFYNKKFTANLARQYLDFYNNDVNFQNATKLAEKYGLESYDKIAQANAKTIAELKRIIEEDR